MLTDNALIAKFRSKWRDIIQHGTVSYAEDPRVGAALERLAVAEAMMHSAQAELTRALIDAASEANGETRETVEVGRVSAR